MRYSVILLPSAEIDGYVAYVPAVDVVTQGYSIGHALEMAAEAAGLKLDALVDAGDEIPSEGAGVIFTSVEVTLGESVRIDTGLATATVGGSENALGD
jgi:predicted RNase H-like HicB family nuclease